MTLPRITLGLGLILLSGCTAVSVAGDVAGTALKTTGRVVDAVTFAPE